MEIKTLFTTSVFSAASIYEVAIDARVKAFVSHVNKTLGNYHVTIQLPFERTVNFEGLSKHLATILNILFNFFFL